jgi:hypothetical protein
VSASTASASESELLATPGGVTPVGNKHTVAQPRHCSSAVEPEHRVLVFAAERPRRIGVGERSHVAYILVEQRHDTRRRGQHVHHDDIRRRGSAPAGSRCAQRYVPPSVPGSVRGHKAVPARRTLILFPVPGPAAGYPRRHRDSGGCWCCPTAPRRRCPRAGDALSCPTGSSGVRV